jgi:3,4-dihydroxy 2-butanone 4-phosphate synthase/GTP cyclohydrolase II
MIEELAATLAGAAAHRRLTGRPFVTLSYAQSLDGSIGTRAGGRLLLSGPAALELTHALRAAHDGLLIGIGTLLADDPRLTVRLVAGPDPRPIVVDSHLRFPPAARLLRDHPRSPWIATLTGADPARAATLEAAGACLLRLPADGAGRVDLPVLLCRLGDQGIDRLMVEGGTRIITSLLAARLVDYLVLTLAPLLVGGRRAMGDPPALMDTGAWPRLPRPVYRPLGGDLIVHGALSWDGA